MKKTSVPNISTLTIIICQGQSPQNAWIGLLLGITVFFSQMLESPEYPRICWHLPEDSVKRAFGVPNDVSEEDEVDMFQKRPFVHNSVCSQFSEARFAILAECSQFCLRGFS